MGQSIINPALSLLMKHIVIGQRQKSPNFSAFHWSPHGSLVSIGQHFVTTRVLHLPKRTERSLITESDLIIESNQAVRAVHSCNTCSWFKTLVGIWNCVAKRQTIIYKTAPNYRQHICIFLFSKPAEKRDIMFPVFILRLKEPITTTADDIYNTFFIVFQRE